MLNWSQVIKTPALISNLELLSTMYLTLYETIKQQGDDFLFDMPFIVIQQFPCKTSNLYEMKQ